MNSVCAACKQDITTKRSINCTQCEGNYHQICVKHDSSKQNANWLCPSCRSKAPRADSNNTPAHPSTSTAELNVSLVNCVNTQSRAHKRMAISSPGRDDLEDSVSLSELVTEIRLMRLDMAEVKSTLKKLFDGVDKCNARLDIYGERIAVLEQNCAQVAATNEIIDSLKDQLNQQTQAGMRNEIEIIGVGETTKENLHHIVMVTAAKIGVNLTIDDIDWVARAGLKRIPSTNSDSDSARPVIVKLLRRAKKEELIKAFKTRRNLSSQDIEIQGPTRKIFINDHLTKANRVLFREARTRAKNAGFKFCWTSRGQILVRRAEGKPARQIKNITDLDNLIGAAPTTLLPFPTATN